MEQKQLLADTTKQKDTTLVHEWGQLPAASSWCWLEHTYWLLTMVTSWNLMISIRQ